MGKLFMHTGDTRIKIRASERNFADMLPHLPWVRFGETGARLFPINYVGALAARRLRNVEDVRAFAFGDVAKELIAATLASFNEAFAGDTQMPAFSAANILGVTRITLYNWADAGIIPDVRVSIAARRRLTGGVPGRTELVVSGAAIRRAALWHIPDQVEL